MHVLLLVYEGTGGAPSRSLYIIYSPPEHAEMRFIYLSLNEHDILTDMRGQICCLQYFMFFVQIFVDLGTGNKAAHVPWYHDKSTYKHGLNTTKGDLTTTKGEVQKSRG